MTNREDIVQVKASVEGGVAFSMGEKYGLKLAAGETTDKWLDGSPITRAEFYAILAPNGPFEIVPPAAAGSVASV
jgi:hypothetical protein